MAEYNFTAPSGVVDFKLLKDEILSLRLSGGSIVLTLPENVTFDQTSIDAVQEVITNHTGSPKDSVLISYVELLGLMSFDEMSAVVSNDPVRKILEILTTRGSIILNANTATKLLDFLETNTLISTDTKNIIIIALEEKGLIFS